MVVAVRDWTGCTRFDGSVPGMNGINNFVEGIVVRRLYLNCSECQAELKLTGPEMILARNPELEP